MLSLPMGNETSLSSAFKAGGLPEHYRADEVSCVPPGGKVALLVIDVQKHSCQPDYATDTGPYYGSIGNDETDRVAKGVKDFADKVRAAGGTIISVHLDDPDNPSDPGFYEFQPDPAKGDITMPKPSSSAFDRTDLHQQLKERGIDTLLLAGVNLSSCVKLTAMDARTQGYNTWLVSDLTGDDSALKQAEAEYRDTEFADMLSARSFIEGMKKAGVGITDSSQPLPAAQEQAPASSEPGRHSPGL